MVRQVAGRRRPAAPRSPACPRRLRASRLSAPRVRRSPRPPRSPPAAAAATARCSAPQPSSEPRRRQAAGPAPSHSRQGGGVCAATGEGRGGSGRVRTPGGVGPGRAPRGRLSWRRAGSRPEGANPHCERWEAAPPPGAAEQTDFLERGLAWVWAGFNLGDCSRLLAPRRGAREEPRVPGPGFPWFESGLLTPPNPVARPSLLVAELVGEKQQESSRERRRTGARAQEEALPLRRVSRPAWLILQIGGKRGARGGVRDRLGRSRRG